MVRPGGRMSTLARILCAIDLEKSSERACSSARVAQVLLDHRLISAPSHCCCLWRSCCRYTKALEHTMKSARAHL
jgi:hypothetical protein